MTNEIAHASVGVDLRDEDLIAGLRRIEAEFKRTTDKISHTHATATADLDLAPLRDDVANAKRYLRELQGQHAQATLSADKKRLKKDIAEAKKIVATLDGDLAKVEIKVLGEKEAIAAIGRVKAAEAAQAAAEEKHAARREQLARQQAAADERRSRENLRRVNADARVRQSLENQRAIEMRRAEAEAYRVNRQRTIGVQQEVGRVLELQKQYARLTDKLERLNKQHPIGKEARAKVVLDATGVVAKMEALKAELSLLGREPPVDIKANVNERGLRRAKTTISGWAATIANKLSGLSDLSIRLGPFTTSLRGLGLALAYLGPTITDLVGAAGSLVGVLGAGIMGASSVASSGVVGLGADFLGLKFSMRNTMQEVANVRTAYGLLQKAQQKGDPDKIKLAQTAYNNTLKNVSPLAREAALGVERFFSTWDKHTVKTRENLGKIAHDGFAALRRITPMWAHQTNEMSTSLQKGLHSAFQFLSRGAGKGLLSNIIGNFNAQVPTLLHALGSLGHAFLNFASEGSGHFHSLADGFDHFATNVLKFTQRDDFHATVSRWVADAGDVVHFLGNMSRVLVHFFGDGSRAGDDFINTMSHALKRWDKFLTSTQGKNTMAQWFHNSVKGTEELYNALRPIVQLFALWATGLEPFVTMVTKIATFVTKLAEAFGRLVGLGNPLATLGTTLGAMFAVSKIGGFVAMLSRGVGLMRAMAGEGRLLRGLLSGDLWRGMRQGGGIAAAAKEGAASMAESILAASESGAAMYAEALRAGGAVAATEVKAGEIEGGAIAGAEEGAGEAAGGLGGLAGAGRSRGLIGGLTRAVGGLGLGLGALVGVAAAAGGAAVIFGGRAKDAADKVNDLSKATRDAATNVRKDVGALGGAYTDLANSTLDVRSSADDVRAAQKALDKAKPGTREYTAALQQLNAALDHQRAAQKAVNDAQRKASGFHSDLLKAERQHVAANKEWGEAVRKLVPDMKSWIDLQGNFQKVTGKKTVADLNVNDLIKYGDQIKAVDGHQKEWEKDVAALRRAHDDLVNSENNSANAARAYANAQVNARRALQGFEPLATGARVAMDKLMQSIGHTKAVKIAVKFPNPQQAGQVMNQMNSAIASGTPKNRVFDVVANSKTAEQALRRLNSIRITPKRLEIMESGGDLAVRMLQRILGIKLDPKTVQVITRGGPEARAMVMSLLGMKLPPKLLRLLGDDRDAKNKVRAANSQRLNPLAQVIRRIIQNPPNLFGVIGSAIQWVTRKVRGGADGGVFPLAGGGATPSAAVIERAANEAERRGPRSTRGGTYSRPTLLVGEEHRTEYVIATNPSYRERNIGYLKMAAADLGAHVVEAAATGRGRRGHSAAHPPTAASMTAPAKKQHLARVSDYAAAAVPVDWIQKKYDGAVQKIKSDKSKESSLNDQIKTADKTAADRGSSKHTREKAASHSRDLAKQRKRVRDDIKATEKLRDDYKKKLDALNAANREIEHLNSRIATDKTLMDNASTAYDSNPQKKYVDAWTAAKDDRSTAITKLKGILKTALATAKTIKRMPGEGAWIDDLAGSLTDLGSTELENNNAEAPDTVTTMDLDWLLKNLGLTDSYKKAVADLAVAKTNDVADDPGTAAREDLDSLKDNLAPAKSIMDTLTTALTGAQATGNQDLIAETADALSSARDEYNSINSSFSDAAAETGPSQLDLMDTARADLYKNYGSNFNPNFGASGPSGAPGGGMQANVSLAPDMTDAARASSAMAPNVAGGAGSGAVSDATGGKSVVNNVTNHFSVPPPDPHSWSQGVAFELGAMV